MDECDFCSREIPFSLNGVCEPCKAEGADAVLVVDVDVLAINEDRRMRAMSFGARALND